MGSTLFSPDRYEELVHFVQTKCTAHEWVEITVGHTSAKEGAPIYTSAGLQCRLCGILKPVEPTKQN
jgi:hypothetical protein